MIHYEIRPTVNRSAKINLVPTQDRYNYVGFTSVYGFPPGTTARIRTTGSTGRLNRFPVYSDVLYMDFDDNDAAAWDFFHQHILGKYEAEVYTSGGRSIHFHIPITPMQGSNVPYSQKYWVQQRSEAADTSMYTHSGLFRLPGTYHAKNPGNKKRLLCVLEGDRLHIENRIKVSAPSLEEDTELDFNIIMGKLLHMRVGEGDNRHKHAYKIVAAGKSAGIDEHRTRRLLGMWNQQNCLPAKSEWELDKIIRWVYND